jgi:hypothetical protein
MQSIRLKYRTRLERNCIQAREFMAMKTGGSEKAAMVQAWCWPRSKRPSSPPGGGKSLAWIVLIDASQSSEPAGCC